MFPHIIQTVLWLCLTRLSNRTWNKWRNRYSLVFIISWLISIILVVGIMDRMRSKLYDNTDDVSLPIEFANFLFPCSNVLAAPSYGVCICQLIGYSRVCISWFPFLGVAADRQVILYQMKLSDQIFNGRHYELQLVDCHKISVSS